MKDWCDVSRPVSMIAILLPAPEYPSAQAPVAPTIPADVLEVLGSDTEPVSGS